MSGEGGRGIQYRGLSCDSSGGNSELGVQVQDRPVPVMLAAILGVWLWVTREGDGGPGRSVNVTSSETRPHVHLQWRLPRVSCPQRLGPSRPRAGPVSAAGARQPSVLGRDFSPLLPAAPRPSPPSRWAASALRSLELPLLQAVLFIPRLPPQRQLCGSSRIASF